MLTGSVRSREEDEESPRRRVEQLAKLGITEYTCLVQITRRSQYPDIGVGKGVYCKENSIDMIMEDDELVHQGDSKEEPRDTGFSHLVRGAKSIRVRLTTRQRDAKSIRVRLTKRQRDECGHEVWPVGWERIAICGALFAMRPPTYIQVRHPGSKAQIASTPHDPSQPTGRWHAEPYL